MRQAAEGKAASNTDVKGSKRKRDDSGSGAAASSSASGSAASAVNSSNKAKLKDFLTSMQAKSKAKAGPKMGTGEKK